ncbi:MAG: hypothetical protein IKA12_03510 [Clostridia bacterium]|nr:hypothetical protein [Clostridia bacterium]
MIKKIYALILAFSIVVCSVMFSAVKDTVYAEPNNFGGYYETLENQGVIEFGSLVGNVSSAVITGKNQTGGNLSENVTVSVDGTKVVITQLPTTLQDAMVLGNYYSLTINNSISAEFRFVSKAIYDKDDIRVLNITDQNTPILGYYVLANNLILEKGEENQHDVNGEEKGHGLYYATYGFRGTFDGQGHNIEFWANNAGFFGALGLGGVIKNTGFVNVHVYTPNANPVLFHGATWLWIDPATNTNDRALVENVYVRMADGEIPEGAISVSGSIPLMLHNVVLDFPGANVDHNTGDISVGALWGADYGWWVANGSVMKEIYDPLSYKDVYIIGRMPASHYKYIHPDNSTGKKGFYTKDDGSLGRGWMEGFAENEGVTEDIFNGNKVYKGVRKYNTLALLADDKTNNYSSFDTRYWGVEEYGLPVWKNGVENNFNIFLDTDGPKTMAAFWLEIGGIDEAAIGFGLGGIKAGDAVINFEIIKGQELISTNSETGVVTAEKEGMAQFYAKCFYNGKEFSKKYTVYITVAENYIEWGPIIKIGSIVASSIVILSAVVILVLKRKKSKT